MTVPIDQRLDLHLHSNCSDGRLAPLELLKKARGRLGLISICDHDTLSAYRELPDSTEPRILPGVEISARVNDNDLHLLCYFPGGYGKQLEEWVGELSDQRREGIRLGVSRLREAGVPLRWDRLEEEVQGGVPCRSHVARALVSIGFARATGGLYQRFLNRERFPGPTVTAGEVIDKVHTEGGLVFWAHPHRGDVEAFGEKLVEAGLDGVERWSRSVRGKNREHLGKFQEFHKLGSCGGSDLHQESRALSVGSYWVQSTRIDPRLLGAAVLDAVDG